MVVGGLTCTTTPGMQVGRRKYIRTSFLTSTMSSRKRKHPNRNRYRNDSSSSYNRPNEEQVPFTPDPVLFIQAHEAEIIRGPRGRIAAESLEVKKVPKENQDGYEWVIGGGLIRWGGDAVVHRPFPGDDDDVGGPSTGTSEGLWVDRYGCFMPRILMKLLCFVL